MTSQPPPHELASTTPDADYPESGILESGDPAARSPSPDTPSAGEMAPALAWMAVLVGLAASWAWVTYSPLMSDQIPASSVVMSAATFYAVMFVPLLALGAGLGMLCRVRPFRAGAASGPWLASGLAIGIAGSALSLLIVWLHGNVTFGASGIRAAELLALGAGLTLVQTSAEEMIFRGWLQPVLMRLTGAWPGLLLASLAFAALHMVGGLLDPLSMLNVTLAGLLFGLLAWRSGGMLAPIAAHFGWNAAEDLGFGMVPNPGIGPFGAIRDVEVVGPLLWGGGESGLNSSIGTTLVLLALAVPLLAMRLRASSPV